MAVLFLYKLMITIKPRLISGCWNKKLMDYGPKRDMFEKYKVTQVRTTEWDTIINIQGPKVEFTLHSCKNPLKIAHFNEETNTTEYTTAPLFYVSPFTGGGKIKFATHFALINNELVAYTTSGSGFVRPV